ncbi:MAG TPA: hypothetical protein V6C57_04080 [Coleofasciculaceae cyanobacterium]
MVGEEIFAIATSDLFRLLKPIFTANKRSVLGMRLIMARLEQFPEPALTAIQCILLRWLGILSKY